MTTPNNNSFNGEQIPENSAYNDASTPVAPFQPILMPVDKKICNKCGNMNPQDSEFCQICGNSFGNKARPKPLRNLMPWVYLVCVVLTYICGTLYPFFKYHFDDINRVEADLRFDYVMLLLFRPGTIIALICGILCFIFMKKDNGKGLLGVFGTRLFNVFYSSIYSLYVIGYEYADSYSWHWDDPEPNKLRIFFEAFLLNLSGILIALLIFMIVFCAVKRNGNKINMFMNKWFFLFPLFCLLLGFLSEKFYMPLILKNCTTQYFLDYFSLSVQYFEGFNIIQYIIIKIINPTYIFSIIQNLAFFYWLSGYVPSEAENKKPLGVADAVDELSPKNRILSVGRSGWLLAAVISYTVFALLTVINIKNQLSIMNFFKILSDVEYIDLLAALIDEMIFDAIGIDPTVIAIVLALPTIIFSICLWVLYSSISQNRNDFDRAQKSLTIIRNWSIFCSVCKAIFWGGICLIVASKGNSGYSFIDINSVISIVSLFALCACVVEITFACQIYKAINDALDCLNDRNPGSTYGLLTFILICDGILKILSSGLEVLPLIEGAIVIIFGIVLISFSKSYDSKYTRSANKKWSSGYKLNDEDNNMGDSQI